MKLPNSDRAELGDKLDRYCLNLEHPKNQHKALLFKKRLGITRSNQEILERSLLRAAIENEAIIYRQDQYGTHYDIKFSLQTDIGESLIMSCWIVATNEDFPRLTNAYPIDK